MSDSDNKRRYAAVGAAVSVLLLTGWTLRLIPLDEVLSSTQPTGYDLGPHLYAFERGSARILDGQSPLGWDDGWFAGFPLFYFYFPFPALLLALLRLPLHVHVAMKVVSLLGAVLLPTAAYLFGRRAADSRLVGLGAAAGGALFLETQSFHNVGANLASVLAGEFSFSIGFALSLLLAAYLVGATRKLAIVPAALLLAATVLSHLIPGSMAVLIIAVAAVAHRRKARWVASVYGLGFLVAGFWAVPFLVHSDYFWSGVSFSAFPIAGLFPLELLIPLPLALVGIYALRSSRTALFVVAIMALVGPVLVLLPQPYVHPGRLVPYWFLAVYLLAGVGLGFAAGRVAQSPTRSVLIRALPALIPVLLLVEFRSGQELRNWAEWNYSGVEAKAAWPELAELHRALSALPPGRVHWAANPQWLSRFGTPNALMLIPYHDPAHPVLAGLWRESSPTAAFVQRVNRTAQEAAALAGEGHDAAAAARRLRRQLCTLGVRYYAVHDPGVRNALRGDLAVAATTDRWTVFELPRCALVDVVTGPFPEAEADAFLGRAATRFDSVAPGWLVQAEAALETGPADARSATENPAANRGAQETAANGLIEVVEYRDTSLAFRTREVGVPHVVRISYFPNWRVDGARGPYRAGPNLMIVVPTAPEVRLVFRPGWAERTGWVLTTLALLGLLALGVRVGIRRVRSNGPGATRSTR